MRNLEAKFRLHDLVGARRRAEAVGFTCHGLLIQRDTFFAVPNGKLKLREQGGDACLIHYRRDHQNGPGESGQVAALELSNYDIVPVADANAVRAMLTAALGVVAEVRKQRTLMTRANVRVHLDRVDGLGEFGEIEAVLAAHENPESYRAQVTEILGTLGIRGDGLIGLSYFELMRSIRET